MSMHSMVRRSSMRKSVTSTPNTLEIQITPRGTPNRLTKQTPKSISCVVNSDSSAQKLVFVLGDFLTKPSKSRKSTEEDYYQQVYSDDSDISCSSNNIETLKRKAEEINNTLAILEAKQKLKKKNLQLRESCSTTPLVCRQTETEYPTNPNSSPKRRGRPRKNPTISNETPLIKRKRGRPRKVQVPVYQNDESNRSISEDSLSEFEAVYTISKEKHRRLIQKTNESDEDRFIRYRSTAEACLHGPINHSSSDRDLEANALDLTKSSENTLHDVNQSGIANIRGKDINHCNQIARIQHTEDGMNGYSDLFLASQDLTIPSQEQETVNHYLDHEEPIPPCVWESEPNFDADNQRANGSDNRISLSEADVNDILSNMAVNEGNPILVQELVISQEEVNEPISNKGPDHINATIINNDDTRNDSNSKYVSSNCELKKHKILRHKKFRRKSSFHQNESSADSESDTSNRQQKKKYRTKKTNSINSEHLVDISKSANEIRQSGIEDDGHIKSSNNEGNIRQKSPENSAVLNESDSSLDMIRSSPYKTNRSLSQFENSSPCKLVSDAENKNHPSKNKSTISDSVSNKSANMHTKELDIENQRNKENKSNSNSIVSSHIDQRERRNNGIQSTSPNLSISGSLKNKENSTSNDVHKSSEQSCNRNLGLDPPDFNSEPAVAIDEGSENVPIDSNTNDSVFCPPPANIASPLRIVKEPSVDGGYSSNVSSQIDDKASQNNEPLSSSQNELENCMDRVNTKLAYKESFTSRSPSKVSEKIATSSAPSSSSTFFKNSKFIKPSKSLSKNTPETSKSPPENKHPKEISSEETSSNKLSPNKISENAGNSSEIISEVAPISYSSNEYSSDDELLPSLFTLKKLRKNRVEQLDNDNLSVRSKSPGLISTSESDTFIADKNKGTKYSKKSDSDDLSSSDEEVRNIVSPKVVQQVDLLSNLNSEDGQESSDDENNVQTCRNSKRKKKRSRKVHSSDDDASSIQVLSCEQRLRKNNYSSSSSSDDDSIFSNSNNAEQTEASKNLLENSNTKQCNQNNLLQTSKKALTKLSSSDDSSSGDDIIPMEVNNHPSNGNHLYASSDDDNDSSVVQENHSDDSNNDIVSKATNENLHDDSSDLSSEEEILPSKQSIAVQNHNNDSSDLSSDSDDNKTSETRKPRVVESYDISSDKDQSIKSNDTSSDDSHDQTDNKSHQSKVKNHYYLSPDDSVSSVDDVPYMVGNSTKFKNEMDDEKDEIKMYDYNNDNNEVSIDILTEKRELDESAVWVSLTQDNNTEKDWFQRRRDIEENALVENKLFDEVNCSSKKKSKKNREKKVNEIEEEDSNKTPISKGRKSVRGAKKHEEATIVEDSEVVQSPRGRRKGQNKILIDNDDEDEATIVGPAKKKKGTSDEKEDLSTIEDGKNDSVSKKKRKQGKINLDDSLSNKSIEVEDKSDIEELNNSISKKTRKKNRSFSDVNEIADIDQTSLKIKDSKNSKESRRNNSFGDKDLDDVQEHNESLTRKKNNSFTITNLEEKEDEGVLNISLSKKKNKSNSFTIDNLEDDEGGLNNSISKKKNKNNLFTIDNLEDDEGGHNNSISKKKNKNNSFTIDNLEDDEGGHNNSKYPISKKKNKNNSFTIDNLGDDEGGHNKSISKKKNKNNSFTIDNLEDDEGGPHKSITKNKKKKNTNDSLHNASLGEIDMTVNECDNNNEINESLSKKKSKKNKINNSNTNNGYEDIDMEGAEEFDTSVSKKKKKDKKISSSNALDNDEVSNEKALKKTSKRKRDDLSINDGSISEGSIKKKKKKPLNDVLTEQHKPVSISHLPSHFLQDLASVKPHSSIRKLQKKKEKTKKKFKFIEKNNMNGSDFIPLETSTSTKFGVVPLNASSYGCQTAKGDFKQNMLFSNNIRRTSSQQLKAINMKRKVIVQ